MGIFNFIKDAGSNLFESDRKKKVEKELKSKGLKTTDDMIKAQMIQDHINSLGLTVQNLNVQVKGHAAQVHGSVSDQSIKEKAVLAAGNIEGISKIEDYVTVAQEQPKAQFHEVVAGETLSQISKRYFGDTNHFMDIYEANKPLLKDPDHIYPGQTLRIPRAA